MEMTLQNSEQMKFLKQIYGLREVLVKTSLLQGEEADFTVTEVENVKGLLSSNGGWDFLEYINQLAEAGYDVEWQIFNSKDYGVPQNRERVYTLGHLRSRGGREILPIGTESCGNLKQIIDGCLGYRVYDPTGISVTLASGAGGLGAKTVYT